MKFFPLAPVSRCLGALALLAPVHAQDAPRFAADFDGNGALDSLDVNAFRASLLLGNLQADTNYDGVWDALDIHNFRTAFAEGQRRPQVDIPDGMPGDGEVFVEASDDVAQLTLENGSQLYFVEFEPGNVGVLEDMPEGVTSIGTLSHLLREATIAEVFFAFSEEGSEIPQRLLDASGDRWPIPSGTVQGWGRTMLGQQGPDNKYDEYGSSNCTDSVFKSIVNSKGYNDRGTPDFRMNKVPDSTAFFKGSKYKPGNGKSYWFWDYFVGGTEGSTWYDVDRYYSRVAVCKIDYYEPQNPYGLAHPPISYQGYVNNHMGPAVWFLYRRPGQTTWSSAASKDFSSSQAGTATAWHFYTGKNWDWQTRIYWAGGDDKFDIGHAVEDL